MEHAIHVNHVLDRLSTKDFGNTPIRLQEPERLQLSHYPKKYSPPREPLILKLRDNKIKRTK